MITRPDNHVQHTTTKHLEHGQRSLAIQMDARYSNLPTPIQ